MHRSVYAVPYHQRIFSPWRPTSSSKSATPHIPTAPHSDFSTFRLLHIPTAPPTHEQCKAHPSQYIIRGTLQRSQRDIPVQLLQPPAQPPPGHESASSCSWNLPAFPSTSLSLILQVLGAAMDFARPGDRPLGVVATFPSSSIRFSPLLLLSPSSLPLLLSETSASLIRFLLPRRRAISGTSNPVSSGAAVNGK